MSRTLSKRLKVIEALQGDDDEKPVIFCLPVNSWAKAEGEEVAPGVWYRLATYYGRDCIHYEDETTLRQWLDLPDQSQIRGVIYRVIGRQEFEDIRAGLESQC